jgi:hypothetical protein
MLSEAPRTVAQRDFEISGTRQPEIKIVAADPFKPPPFEFTALPQKLTLSMG